MMYWTYIILKIYQMVYILYGKIFIDFVVHDINKSIQYKYNKHIIDMMIKTPLTILSI